MQDEEKQGKYAPTAEFLLSCGKAGHKFGSATGKAEFAVLKAAYCSAVGVKAVTRGVFAGHKAHR